MSETRDELIDSNQAINDLSALLEDANTSVSNSLTFAPDELTDTLEILQVGDVDSFMHEATLEFDAVMTAIGLHRLT